ncbi:MAG: N-acetylneuraminate synthase family protein [Verrucomicrobiota bacterium]|nr:N-acetylneuraminate synthase family protein [Verrucomicrobiota bacterium]
MNLAKEMIDAAKKAGADAVKFQTFKAESLVSKGTPKVKYQESTTSHAESHFEMIKSLELSYDNHFFLQDYCLKKDIKFLSTPYDVESARFLNEDLDVEMFKSASADLVDLSLHDYIASTGKPSIISVGMASMGEIKENLKIYNSYNHKDIILLHCVSNYPCAHENLNLRVLETLKQAFDLPVGYSDHSIGSEAAVLSIGLGAKIVEKHFTLDKSLPGPDHLASSTPDEFKLLVDLVRKAETILGSSIKTCQDEERQMAEVSRKSIVLKNDLFKGDILKKEDLVYLRPGTGIYPIFLNKTLGKRIKKDLVKGTQLSWTHITG